MKPPATQAGLLALYRNGTRATIMISLPILITLIIRGRTFIGFWMGPQYAQSSGTVLIILCSALFFAFANRTASAIAYGVEKHKTAAIWAIGEGVTNLALSVTLVHWYGIYGVAFGTMVPNLIAQLVFWPRYISKLVGLSSWEVIWGVWGPMFLAGVPFALASYAVSILLPAPQSHDLLPAGLSYSTCVLPHGCACLSRVRPPPGRAKSSFPAVYEGTVSSGERSTQ